MPLASSRPFAPGDSVAARALETDGMALIEIGDATLLLGKATLRRSGRKTVASPMADGPSQRVLSQRW